MTKEDLKKIRDLREAGYPMKYIAHVTHYTLPTIWKYTKDMAVPRGRWTKEEVRMLVELRATGMYFKDIAPLVGHPTVGCNKKYNIIMGILK